eukprot:GFUD01043366.1.p1 GENE.GFUD01043366.1~~GFUD01043366.1.p1  ORF type:complete len:368 (+),score=96.36 GFUD01043366.1:29-1105(+)
MERICGLICTVLLFYSLQYVQAVSRDEGVDDCQKKVWCRNINWAFRVYSGQSGGYIAKTDDYYSNVVVNLADFNDDKIVDFEEFKNVSETYLAEGFKIFDVNMDGLVAPEEAFIGNISKQLFTRIVENTFWIADRNGDGEVSTDDLIETQIEDFDTNGDGKVSLRELLGRPIIFFPAPIVSVYRILDSNKNEVIEEKEMENFISFMSRIFNVLDRDTNCSVDFEEFLAALDSCGLPHDYQLAMDLALRPYISLANYLIKSTIAVADVNKDNKLSMQEILNFSDSHLEVKPYKVVEPFFYQPNMIPIWYMGGHMDFYGKEHKNEEDKITGSRRAIANWLSTFQGFMRDQAFSGTRHGHC